MGLLFSHKDNSVKITHPEKIFHEEKRAPTEKSIELAIEYEQLIEKKIVEKLMVQGNIVQFSLAFQNELLFNKMHIKIKINEKELTETFTIDDDVEKLLDKLIKWISKMILIEPIREIVTVYASGQKNGYKYIGIK